MSSDTVTAGSKFGFWTVIQTTGRTAVAQCACGSIRRVSVDALVSSTSTSCGCYGPSRPAREEAEQRQQQRDQGNQRPNVRR